MDLIRIALLTSTTALALPALAQMEPRPQQDTQRERKRVDARSPGKQVGALEPVESERYGAYLTDREGRSLYMFEKDKRGGDASTCHGACARAWPPALGEVTDVRLGEGMRKELLGTIERPSGAKQLTYGGWPLYYYARDRRPGETRGQGVDGFGAPWYLVAPDGDKIERGTSR